MTKEWTMMIKCLYYVSKLLKEFKVVLLGEKGVSQIGHGWTLWSWSFVMRKDCFKFLNLNI